MPREVIKFYNQDINRVHFNIMDASDLTQFDDNSCSGAYISWVLEHLTENKAINLLQGLKRIIENSGSIIINEAIMSSVNCSKCILPLTKKFTKALVTAQKEGRGNADFGNKIYMIDIIKNVGFKNFYYKKLPLHNLKNKKMQREFKNWMIDNYNSIFPLLESREKFSLRDFEDMKQEIYNCNKLKMYFGQIMISN